MGGVFLYIYAGLWHQSNLPRGRSSSSDEADCTAKVPTDANDPEFSLLQRKIPHEALRLLKQQLKLAISKDYKETEACSGAFTATYGLPCKHFLHHKARDLPEGEVYHVKLAQVDQHWWLDPPRARGEAYNPDAEVFRPLDPLKVRAKGRPKGATAKTLPKPNSRKRQAIEARELSAFEYAEASQQPPPPSPGASHQASLPAKKRVYRRKITTTTTVEERDELEPAPVLDAATFMTFQKTLQEQIGSLQLQIAELQQKGRDGEIELLSEEEHRSSDEDFPSPKPQVALTKSKYSTRSKKGKKRG